MTEPTVIRLLCYHGDGQPAVGHVTGPRIKVHDQAIGYREQLAVCQMHFLLENGHLPDDYRPLAMVDGRLARIVKEADDGGR